MNSRKIITWITTAMILSSTLAGCGSSATTTSSGKKEEVVNLTYTTWGSPNERQTQGDAVKAFEKANPNIKVNFQHIPADYETKLATMIAGNTPPDVALLNKTTSLTWADQGKIYNIKPLLDKDADITTDSYINGSFVYGAPDKIVGITPCQEVFGLFYNVDMFKDAGVELPPTKAADAWTWDQFIKVAQQLTIDQNGKNALQPGFDKEKIKQYGVNLPLWAWQTFLVLNDTKFVSDDGKSSKLSDPAVAETLQRYGDLINKYHVAPSLASQKTLPAPAIALQSKKVAMDYDGQWVLQDLAAAKLNFGVGVLPKMKRCTTTLFGELIVMMAGTKHPKEAWKLEKWMTGGVETKALMTSGLWMPAIKDMYTKPELVDTWAVKPAHPDGYKDAIMTQAMSDSVPDVGYFLKNSVKILSIITPALDQVWLGKKTATDVLKEVEPKVIPELQGVYIQK